MARWYESKIFEHHEWDQNNYKLVLAVLIINKIEESGGSGKGSGRGWQNGQIGNIANQNAAGNSSG